ENVNVGDAVTFTLYAADNAGVVDKTLTVNGAPLALADNQADYLVTEMGEYLAQATASDAAGFTASDSVSFYAIDPNDVTPPIASLDETDCPDVTDLTSITGTVSDAGPVFYGLYFREQGANAWISLKYGKSDNGSITGELGLFDPTLLRNGVYEIILYAMDLNGNYAMDQGCALVEGGMKIGVVNLPAVDVSMPEQGFPLSLEREYDSRDAGPGDFGPGWNLPTSNVKAMTTESLSGGWGQEV
ncbi:MAG: hypothetical protein GY859_36695, partial [Desulfobacterales bacterium]|nr:hypothetical protein [Desulfobacterales bacterium]